MQGLAAAARWLRFRLGGGRGIFRRGEQGILVAVRTFELVDRLDRPFLERQLAVLVDVELGERLAPRFDQFGERDPAVVILVGARETFFFLALRVGRGSLGPSCRTDCVSPITMLRTDRGRSRLNAATTSSLP